MRTTACVLTITLAAGAAAAAAGSWSYWSYVNGDLNLKYRQEVNSYGSDISPDCGLEIHNESGLARSVRVEIAYAYPGGASTKTTTEYFDSDSQIAVDSLDPCSRILSVTALKTERR
jgi:hypothetical protein